MEHIEYIPVEPLAVEHVDWITQPDIAVDHAELIPQEPFEIKTVEMIQPEAYEIVHEIREPIVHHHVEYTSSERGQEVNTFQRGTGAGAHVVDGWETILPVEAAHLNDPRINTGGLSPQTYSGGVRDVPVTAGIPVAAVPAVGFAQPVRAW